MTDDDIVPYEMCRDLIEGCDNITSITTTVNGHIMSPIYLCLKCAYRMFDWISDNRDNKD